MLNKSNKNSTEEWQNDCIRKETSCSFTHVTQQHLCSGPRKLGIRPNIPFTPSNLPAAIGPLYWASGLVNTSVHWNWQNLVAVSGLSFCTVWCFFCCSVETFGAHGFHDGIAIVSFRKLAACSGTLKQHGVCVHANLHVLVCFELEVAQTLLGGSTVRSN